MNITNTASGVRFFIVLKNHHRNMETKYVRSLLTVIEHGSIVVAAEKENVTPSAVGQRIRCLEQELGIKLFIRSGHGITPTVECKQLIPKFRQVVELSGQLKYWRKRSRDHHLKLGVMVSAMCASVRGFVPQFFSDLKATHVSLRVGKQNEIIQDLVDSYLDYAIIVDSHDTPENLVYYDTLLHDKLYFLSKTPSRESVFQRLSSEPIVRLVENLGGKDRIMRFLSDHTLYPQIALETDCTSLLLESVQAGIGNCLLHQSSFRDRDTSMFNKILIDDPRYQRELLLYGRAPHDQQHVQKMIMLLKRAYA